MVVPRHNEPRANDDDDDDVVRDEILAEDAKAGNAGSQERDRRLRVAPREAVRLGELGRDVLHMLGEYLEIGALCTLAQVDKGVFPMVRASGAILTAAARRFPVIPLHIAAAAGASGSGEQDVDAPLRLYRRLMKLKAEWKHGRETGYDEYEFEVRVTLNEATYTFQAKQESNASVITEGITNAEILARLRVRECDMEKESETDFDERFICNLKVYEDGFYEVYATDLAIALVVKQKNTGKVATLFDTEHFDPYLRYPLSRQQFRQGVAEEIQYDDSGVTCALKEMREEVPRLAFNFEFDKGLLRMLQDDVVFTRPNEIARFSLDDFFFCLQVQVGAKSFAYELRLEEAERLDDDDDEHSNDVELKTVAPLDRPVAHYFEYETFWWHVELGHEYCPSDLDSEDSEPDAPVGITMLSATNKRTGEIAIIFSRDESPLFGDSKKPSEGWYTDYGVETDLFYEEAEIPIRKTIPPLYICQNHNVQSKLVMGCAHVDLAGKIPFFSVSFSLETQHGDYLDYDYYREQRYLSRLDFLTFVNNDLEFA